MMNIPDFTNLPHKNKTYGGANGSKRCVVINGEDYLLKFPPTPTKNKEMSYTNSCISEYIGCHILQSLGITIQETLLGIYRHNGKEKIVVACKDFTSVGIRLQDFASLKNQIIDSVRNGYGTEIDDIIQTFEEQTALDPQELSGHFWNLFIADALIGNWDRHNGNWGFLYDERTDTMTFAPIYDCGSSLFPQAGNDTMQKVLTQEAELNARIFNIPTSAITKNGKRINYFNFISSLEYEGCNEALKRITPQINLNKIAEIVDNTPFISQLQKDFFKTIIIKRKEKILDYSLNKLLNLESEYEPSQNEIQIKYND